MFTLLHQYYRRKFIFDFVDFFTPTLAAVDSTCLHWEACTCSVQNASYFMHVMVDEFDHVDDYPDKYNKCSGLLLLLIISVVIN